MGNYNVEMLKGDSSYDLERVIKRWLDRNKVEVLNISHSAYSVGDKTYYSALILYK